MDGGTKVYSNDSGHLTKMAAIPIYVKILQKSSPLKPAGRFPLNLVYSIYDPGPTKFVQLMILTFFRARITLLPNAFVWKKALLLDIIETIEVCELKVGTSN